MSNAEESEISRMRKDLGISTTQLAYRLGKNQSTVVRFEQAELKGTISLKSLRCVAEALGCRLVYAYVPEKSGKKHRRIQHGLRRIKRAATTRPKSTVEAWNRVQELQMARSLGSAGRVLRACKLSDTTVRLRACLRKRSSGR